MNLLAFSVWYSSAIIVHFTSTRIDIFNDLLLKWFILLLCFFFVRCHFMTKHNILCFLCDFKPHNANWVHVIVLFHFNTIFFRCRFFLLSFFQEYSWQCVLCTQSKGKKNRKIARRCRYTMVAMQNQTYTV